MNLLAVRDRFQLLGSSLSRLTDVDRMLEIEFAHLKELFARSVVAYADNYPIA